jgi:DinB family protein
LPGKSLSIEDVLALLANTPTQIRAVTAGLSTTQLQTRPSPDDWSANEVLAHLRACADVRGDVIPRILAEDRPTIRAVNPLTWIKHTDYFDLDFPRSFRAFARQRANLLGVLESLPANAWSRSARVTGAGKPLERTVLQYADWVAVHERPHVKQIRSIVEAVQGRMDS